MRTCSGSCYGDCGGATLAQTIACSAGPAKYLANLLPAALDNSFKNEHARAALAPVPWKIYNSIPIAVLAHKRHDPTESIRGRAAPLVEQVNSYKRASVLAVSVFNGVCNLTCGSEKFMRTCTGCSKNGTGTKNNHTFSVQCRSAANRGCEGGMGMLLGKWSAGLPQNMH